MEERFKLFKIGTALRDGSNEMDIDAEVCNFFEFRLISVNGINMITLSKHCSFCPISPTQQMV